MPTTTELRRRYIEAAEREGAAKATLDDLAGKRGLAEAAYNLVEAPPEPSAEELELAAVRGAADAFVALATARSKEVALTPDSDGAEGLWDHAPRPPYSPGTRQEDAYMDSWFSVAHAGLVMGEAVMRYSFKSGKLADA